MRNLIVLLFWLIAKPRREVLISAKNRLGEPIEHLRLSGDSGETFRIKGKDAYKPYNRVLGMVLSGFMDHFESLSLILQHYADMCEFGMDVTVLIDTFTPFSLSMIEYVRKKYFCHRIGEPIAMELFVFNSSARLALSGANRVHISENLDKYDLFIYQEDDIIVTLQHVQSILASRRRLEETLGVKGARIYGEGFWRYRRNLPKKNWESLYKFAGGPMSVPPRYNYSEDKGSLKVPDHRNTFYLEEKLDLHPVCIGNSSLSGSQKLPYYIAGSNIHQASFVLTDDQVRYMNRTCGFCSQEYMHGREYMSTFSVYDGVRFWNSMMRFSGSSCGIKKVFPAEHFLHSGVWHYYLGKWGSSIGPGEAELTGLKAAARSRDAFKCFAGKKLLTSDGKPSAFRAPERMSRDPEGIQKRLEEARK